MVVGVRSTLGHGRPKLPWAPHNTRPIDPKNNRDSEDEGKIGKNPKNQEDERIMSRMTERAQSARMQLQNSALAHEALAEYGGVFRGGSGPARRDLSRPSPKNLAKT